MFGLYRENHPAYKGGYEVSQAKSDLLRIGFDDRDAQDSDLWISIDEYWKSFKDHMK